MPRCRQRVIAITAADPARAAYVAHVPWTRLGDGMAGYPVTVHYAEMLPERYRPTAEALNLFEHTLNRSARRLALAVGITTEKVLACRGPRSRFETAVDRARPTRARVTRSQIARCRLRCVPQRLRHRLGPHAGHHLSAGAGHEVIGMVEAIGPDVLAGTWACRSVCRWFGGCVRVLRPLPRR